MKKESLLVFFYVLYFIWLFALTYLSLGSIYLNYFTISVIVFYFLFLREKLDLILFLVTTAIVAITMSSEIDTVKQEFIFHEDVLFSLPLWLVLSWSITILAIRKLIAIVYH